MYFFLAWELALFREAGIFRMPMGKFTGELVPAVRDEKKIRRTAWILAAFALVGGVTIFSAYVIKANDSRNDNRPAYVGQLFQNLALVRQDAQRTGLDELKGKVWIMTAVSVSQPESCARSLGVLKTLEEKYRNNPDVAFVCMVIDPGPPENAAKILADEAAKHGAVLPRWWYATTEPAILHKYLKDKFRLGSLPHQEEGKWVYDSSLVLVDRGLKIRRAVVPQQRGGPPYVTGFDFDQAAGWDAKGIKTGTPRNHVEEMQLLLEKTIDQLLSETVNAGKS